MVGTLAPDLDVRFMNTQLGCQHRHREAVLVFIEGFKNSKLGAEVDQVGCHKALLKFADLCHLGFCTDFSHGGPPSKSGNETMFNM